MAQENQGQLAGPANIQKIGIASVEQQGKIVDISAGIVELRYWESILQDSPKATITFMDSGNSIDKKSVIEGLPLHGTEPTLIVMTDNYDNETSIEMVVSKVSTLKKDTTKSLVYLVLDSEEHYYNGSSSIRELFEGNIADTIKKIFTATSPAGLASVKELDIEEVGNPLSYYGNGFKAYYVLNNLAKKAKPQGGGGTKSAGYFFFGTSEKMIFKSIDSFFDEEKNPRKLSIIYNNSPDRTKGIPEGYDVKALSYETDIADASKQSEQGSKKTKQITFDPANFNFTHVVLSAIEAVGNASQFEPLKTAAEELPKFNPNFLQEAARTTISLLDSGTTKTLDESEAENYTTKDIENQSIMRYNQMFATRVSVTIPGNFSLHAGDLVFFDGPSLQEDTKNDEIDNDGGGLYIIASLCHYVSPERTLTKLSLIRDSFGRTGNHTSR
jgi:hypothetical protein|tara:strand:+ start:1778 stop:3103 length:1326 start_codon:yes stop_codon:yes gene_type:complete